MPLQQSFQSRLIGTVAFSPKIISRLRTTFKKVTWSFLVYLRCELWISEKKKKIESLKLFSHWIVDMKKERALRSLVLRWLISSDFNRVFSHINDCLVILHHCRQCSTPFSMCKWIEHNLEYDVSTCIKYSIDGVWCCFACWQFIWINYLWWFLHDFWYENQLIFLIV